MSKADHHTHSDATTVSKLNYLDFFSLSFPPFRNRIDKNNPFLTLEMEETRKRINTILDYPRTGIIIVNGAPGSGKTTLINHVINNRNEDAPIARINRTFTNVNEFLKDLLRACELSNNESEQAILLTRFQNFLNEQDRLRRRLILLIDEAQNLKPDVLELLPTLIARPSGGVRCLLILLGQDVFIQILNLPYCQGIRDITRHQSYLKALSQIETREYIQYQLQTSGNKQEDLFSIQAIEQIYQQSSGNMRLINALCDFALFNAYLARIKFITPELIQLSIKTLRWDAAGKNYQEPINPTPVELKLPDESNQFNQINQLTEQITQNAVLILMFAENTEYRIEKNLITIGRAPDNDICIPHPRVSRHHAKITLNNQEIWIEDLDSTNGIYVNQERVQRSLLKDNDIIAIDANLLKFLLR